VKALAVSTKERMPQLPNVPTVAETVPGYEYVAWNGYAVPGGIPAEVAARLTEPLKTIAKDPEVVKIFTNLGIDSVGTSQEEALASVRKDLPIYAQIVDQAGVRKK
jgi:tripartite-type tricarboxylate transporter receptor subunit TctC